jgi:hypothetical protein
LIDNVILLNDKLLASVFIIKPCTWACDKRHLPEDWRLGWAVLSPRFEGGARTVSAQWPGRAHRQHAANEKVKLSR